MFGRMWWFQPDALLTAVLQLNDASRAAVVSDIRRHYPQGEVHLNEVASLTNEVFKAQFLEKVLTAISLAAAARCASHDVNM